MWKRLSGGPDEIIECGSVNFKADGWSRYRRVVIIRRRPVFELQEKLFEEYAWEYEPIATTGSWGCWSTWDFYNHRCTCETYIGELKYGVHIDAISKQGFLPNAADLWLKLIAYNLLRAFIKRAPSP